MDNKDLAKRLEVRRESLFQDIENTKNKLIDMERELRFINNLFAPEEKPKKLQLSKESIQSKRAYNKAEDIASAIKTILIENKNIPMTISQIEEKITEKGFWEIMPKSQKTRQQSITRTINSVDYIKPSSKIKDLNGKPTNTYIIDTTKI